MADEFPTLEVALAVCVLWLFGRGWSLARGARRLGADTTRLVAAIARGQRAELGTLKRGPQAAWLGSFARVAFSVSDGEVSSDAAAELLKDRSERAGRRLRSAAARDLVVCAVLLGALGYARAANLGVSSTFFGLGGLGALLLLASVALRLALERGLKNALERVTNAISERVRSAPLTVGRRCRVCGETALTSVSSPEKLGLELVALGVSELRVCPRCGNIAGEARRKTQQA